MILRAVALTCIAGLALTGCTPGDDSRAAPGDAPAASRTQDPRTAGAEPEEGAETGSAGEPSRPPPWVSPRRASDRAPDRRPDRETLLAGDGRPRPATLRIPAIGVAGLRVVPYVGSPDDAPGTRIQNRGLAASPGGPEGGTGPGGVGNYIVTAHRLSSTRAFEDLPALRPGQRVEVEIVVDGTVVRYTYEIVRTRSTSFRSQASLDRQSAAVPGRPGVRPTRAMITLSTCATPEDHARGNYWSDANGNPEHRIDKIGRLVARTTT